MKSFTLALVLGVMVSSAAFAAFDGAVVDLRKTTSVAKKALRAAGVDSKIEAIRFQDAALATTTHLLFDGAMLFAVGAEGELEDVEGNYAPANRLVLASGKMDVVFVRFAGDAARVVVPDSFFVELPRTATSADLEEVEKKLAETLPSEEFTFEKFKILRRIAVDLKEPRADRYLKAYKKVKKILEDGQRIVLSAEKYRAPFNFGQVQALPLIGTVDLDLARDIVPTYVRKGDKFKTWQSVIPVELRVSN